MPWNPGKVLEVHEDRGTRMALVDFGGVTKTVCLAYVPEVEVGDYTIVHAGFAITQLDEDSALETLAAVRGARHAIEERARPSETDVP